MPTIEMSTLAQEIPEIPAPKIIIFLVEFMSKFRYFLFLSDSVEQFMRYDSEKILNFRNSLLLNLSTFFSLLFIFIF